MAISEVHDACGDFAREYPAGFVAFAAANALAAEFVNRIRGSFPDKPDSSSADIKIITAKDWAFSVFINSLSLKYAGPSEAHMDADLQFTVHLAGAPDQIVTQYHLTLADQPVLPSADDRFLGWVADKTAGAFSLTGNFDDRPTAAAGNKADDALIAAGWIDVSGKPDRARFDKEVHQPILQAKAAPYIELIVPRFPKLNIKVLTPLIQWMTPIEVNYTKQHMIFWSKAAAFVIPGCVGRTVPIQPDPNYQPISDEQVKPQPYAFGFYIPAKYLDSLCDTRLSPSFEIADGGGGSIGWEMSATCIPATAGAGLNGPNNQIIVDSRWGRGSGRIGAFFKGPSDSILASESSGFRFDFMFSGTVHVNWNDSRKQLMCDLVQLNSSVQNPVLEKLPWPIDHIVAEFFGHMTHYGASDIATKMAQNFSDFAILGEPAHIPSNVRLIAATDVTQTQHSAVFATKWSDDRISNTLDAPSDQLTSADTADEA